MRILYLTFYFEPDIGPGAFRNTTLVKELASQLTASDSIHVITTLPNRYESYKPQATTRETWQHRGCPVTVQRIDVTPHKSGYVDQILAFKSFFRRANRLADGDQYDLVVASSSRLFTAFLGSWISRKHKLPLFLDIRDLFREAIRDVLKQRWFTWLIGLGIDPLLRITERYTFGYAHHINLVSEGFRSYFGAYTQATYSYFTNGVDEAFVNYLPSQSPSNDKPKVVLYAGNIGDGQGLHTIIPELARQLATSHRFVIIGAGGARQKLAEQIKESGLTNVDLRSPVDRVRLIAEYQRADYLFVHLNDLEACKRVIPSKLFEYGATDKPILAGVAGYAASFVRQYIPNSIVFRPGDVADLLHQWREATYYTQYRSEFVHRFRRQTINYELARQIRAVLDNVAKRELP